MLNEDKKGREKVEKFQLIHYYVSSAVLIYLNVPLTQIVWDSVHPEYLT